MSQFAGKSVLITGASGGLGQQLAVDFAREGASVTINYSSSAKAAEDTLARITAAGGRAMVCHADVSCSDDVKGMVEKVVATFGGVDILINNAGLSLDAPFLVLTEHDWDKVVGVNLKGPFLVSQAVGRHMVAAGEGRIVNISATSAVRARMGNANYAASKAGLNMLTQCMALELAPHVSVNALALGFVDSDLVRELFTPEQIDEAKDSFPLKRMTTYAETSTFVLMLASDTASFVTGQTIPFDGGRVMRYGAGVAAGQLRFKGEKPKVETCRGRCFCKAVSFEIEAPVLSCVNCHCESCRRQCSAPITTYIGVPDGQWRWTGPVPKVYRSSPGVERTFCGDCGTPLSFRSERLSGVMHFYLAALEEPEKFQPTLHVAYEEELSWLNIGDDLPKRNGPEYL